MSLTDGLTKKEGLKHSNPPATKPEVGRTKHEGMVKRKTGGKAGKGCK